MLAAMERLLRAGSSYADLGVEQIAREAGISRTAFYFYFRDKREVLEQLTGSIAHELYEVATGWLEGTDEDPGAVRRALDRVAEVYDEHGTLLRVIVEVSTYEPELAVYWRSVIGRFVDATQERIAAAPAAGVASPAGPPRGVAFGLVWMVERALYELAVQDDPPPRGEVLDGLEAIWTAMAAPAARTRS